MTIVLGLLISEHALQVSDRLVTQVEKGVLRRFDPLANKTVIFRARDGILAVGYSGRAYLDRLPTDVWIAQSIAARKFSPQFGIGMVNTSPTHWLHSGPTITRLRTDAVAAIATLTKEERHSYLQQFQIVGIKLAKRTPKIRPFHRGEGRGKYQGQAQPVGDFDKVFKTACAAAGIPYGGKASYTFHCSRRSAARRMHRAGIPEATIMAITGHRTRAMFDWYNIIDERDTAEAMLKLDASAQAPAASNVIPLRRVQAE